jgi:hypothetical protein
MASIELLPSGTHSTVVPLNRDSSVGLESTVGDPSERADVQYQVDNMLLQEIFWNGFPQWICQPISCRVHCSHFTGPHLL